MVRALIDVWRNTGFLPDCRMSFNKGFTQGGSNADSVLSDSFVKGITAGINWEDGLNATITDATVVPPNWAVEGRGGLENRKKLGYVPVDDETPNGTPGRSASRTLEYAFNDFSIALIAAGLNKSDVVEEYVKASADWYNLWNPATTSAGYSGFIQPRYKNGSWMDVDPRRCSPVLDPLGCFLQPYSSEFYEASSWEYSFFVPHDMAKVIQLMGGPRTFVKRLETFFDQRFHDIGDEPGFLPCFLYNYAGRPDMTVDRVLKVMEANFTATLGGLPGNDDSGAMGGFVVFGSFGFYPVAGTSVYLISTPLFPSITIHDPDPNSKNPRTTRIITQNFDGAKTNKYVQSATLNGKNFTRNWFAHDELFGVGGTLELVLGPKPSEWGTKDEDLPPSLSTDGRFDGML
jgi:predicted alpha-1,2-mannosidase